jgi:hypothetical protein
LNSACFQSSLTRRKAFCFTANAVDLCTAFN